jgi:hypothetical protein
LKAVKVKKLRKNDQKLDERRNVMILIAGLIIIHRVGPIQKLIEENHQDQFHQDDHQEEVEDVEDVEI